MNFLVNDFLFVGKSGKFVIIRYLKDRFEKEFEVNVGFKVEFFDIIDGYKVFGCGEFYLFILFENMRCEGYEVGVFKFEVLMYKEDGKLMELIERVVVNCFEVYFGIIINELNMRKGMMEFMLIEGDYVKIEFLVFICGFLGY